MDELIAFLRARLAEDEATARDAGDRLGNWTFEDGQDGPIVRVGHDPDSLWSREGNASVWNCDDVEDGCPEVARSWAAEGEHIARHDPARVLADVAAKRKLLSYITDDSHLCPHPADPDWLVIEAGQEKRLTYPCGCLRALAMPYADHPDYQPEWRPA